MIFIIATIHSTQFRIFNSISRLLFAEFGKMNSWLLFVAVFAISIAMVSMDVSMEAGKCDREPNPWSGNFPERVLTTKNSTHALLVRDRYIQNTFFVDVDDENLRQKHGENMLATAMKIPYPDLKRMLIQFNSKNGQMKFRIWMIKKSSVNGFALTMKNVS